MTFGQKAEWKMVKTLLRNGYDAIHATRTEDRKFKVDIWVRWNDCWLPIQFSLDKEAIVGWKGLDAFQRGIVPIWVDSQELEVAYSNGNGIGLAKEFWTRVEKILSSRSMKRFRTPNWNSHSIINN